MCFTWDHLQPALQGPGGQLGVTADGDARSKWGAGREPRERKLPPFLPKGPFLLFFKLIFHSQEFSQCGRKLPAACCSVGRAPSMQHAAFSAAACLPLGHYLTLPVRLACNLQPLAASAKQRPAFAASADACSCCSCVQYAFCVSGAACAFACCAAACCYPPRSGGLRCTYGDDNFLFGRPKMLISAYPFAPSLLVS